MSTTTSLLCNKFGGIKQKNAVFCEDLVTAQDIQNVELYDTQINGGIGIRTAKGNVSICSSLAGTEKIINIFESIQGGETYFFVHTENDSEGKFYLFENNTLIEKKTGLSVTGVSNGFDITQGWSDLFFFTNGSEMFTIELDADDEIVDMELTDRDGREVIGLVAGVFDSRLWIAKDNVLWYSVKAGIYDFSTADSEITTSAGYIELLKDITAIHEYLDSLAVFHKDSSCLVTVSDGEFTVGDNSPGGCAGINALVFHDTDLYFYDHTKKSVFSFKQVVTGEKTLGENIAVEIQDLLTDIDSAKLDNIFALSVFIEKRNEIWWIIPTQDENYSTIIIYDYLKGQWIKRKSQKINAVRVINNTLYSAGNDGNILEEYNSETFNGEFIESYYNCSPLNLGAMNTLKILKFPPRMSFDLPYNNEFYVKYTKNFNSLKKPKIKRIKAKYRSLSKWDENYWDSFYYIPKHTNVIGRLPNATFKILEISIYTTQEGEDFSIRNLEFSVIKVKQV